jgi:signal transduction histidine kinase
LERDNFKILPFARLDGTEPEGKYFIDPNPFLIDLFQNLIRNTVEYSNGENHEDVEIVSYENNGRDYYRIQVIDYGHGVSPER